MEDERSASGEQTTLGPWTRYNEAALGFRNYWYPVMLSRSLGKKPKALTLLGERIAFFRDRGRVYALANRCPHRGIPLSVGRCEFAGTISCAYHGWTFDLKSGDLVAALTDGPDSPIRGKVHVHTYPVEERAGIVWTYIGEMSPPPVEDDIPEELLREDAVIEGFTEVRKGNWRYAMENCVDEGHAKYLHRTAISQFFVQAPAWTQGVEMVPSEDGRWLERVRGKNIRESEYPGLGRWPSKPFWKKPGSGAPRNNLAVRLPCICRPGDAGKGWQGYQIFVPVDATHHMVMMLTVRWTSGLDALKFRAKYWADIYWMHDLWFQKAQDQWVIEMMEIPPERLYRPDRSITGWRKWCHETARRPDGEPASDGGPAVDIAGLMRR